MYANVLGAFEDLREHDDFPAKPELIVRFFKDAFSCHTNHGGVCGSVCCGSVEYLAVNTPGSTSYHQHQMALKFSGNFVDIIFLNGH